MNCDRCNDTTADPVPVDAQGMTVDLCPACARTVRRRALARYR